MTAILFDCERMKHPYTGLYHFCLNLGARLVKQKHTDESVNFFIPPKLKGIFGEHASYVPKRLIHNVAIPGSKDYRIAVDSSPYDIWHMTYQSSRYRPFRANTKIVLTIHDLNFLHEQPDNDRRKKKYLGIIQDRINIADHIVCISNYCLEDVRRHLKLADKPVSVIYNGCTFYNNPITEPSDKPTRPFLFALGTVLPKKNFHVLPSLLQHFDGDLIISGTDIHPYKDRILEEAQKFDVLTRVKFTGPTSENDKNWYYQHCAAFLFPSIAEGFGLPVLEAMAYGKPVFLSDKTSLPEVGGPHAYYFKNFDAATMGEVFTQGMSHFLTEKPEKKITDWARQFSWEKAADTYWEIYRALSKT